MKERVYKNKNLTLYRDIQFKCVIQDRIYTWAWDASETFEIFELLSLPRNCVGEICTTDLLERCWTHRLLRLGYAQSVEKLMEVAEAAAKANTERALKWRILSHRESWIIMLLD